MTNFDSVDYFTDQSLVPDPHPYFDYLRTRNPMGCPINLPRHRPNPALQHPNPTGGRAAIPEPCQESWSSADSLTGMPAVTCTNSVGRN